MAIELSSKPNTYPDGSVLGGYTYNNGQMKDDPAGVNGTPLDAQTMGDYWQFFATMLKEAGNVKNVGQRVTANGLPDNDTTGQQYFQALAALVTDGFSSVSIGNAGAWIDEPAAPIISSDATATLTSTTYNRYKIIGKTLIWKLKFTATLSGGNTLMFVEMPAAMQAASYQFNSRADIHFGAYNLHTPMFVSPGADAIPPYISVSMVLSGLAPFTNAAGQVFDFTLITDLA